MVRIAAYFRRELVQRFDPDHAYLKQAIRTGISTAIAIVLQKIIASPEAYWLILMGAFMMQTRMGQSQTTMIVNIALCTLAAAMLGYIATLLFPFTWALASYLALASFSAVFLSIYGFRVTLSAFFVNLFVILAAGIPAPGHEALARFYFILEGGLICIGVSFLWPFNAQKRAKEVITLHFESLSEYVLLLAENLTKPKAIYAQKLQERRARLLKRIQLLQEIEQYEPQKQLIFQLWQGLHAFAEVHTVLARFNNAALCAAVQKADFQLAIILQRPSESMLTPLKLASFEIRSLAEKVASQENLSFALYALSFYFSDFRQQLSQLGADT